MDVSGYKDALLRKKGELVGSGGIKPLQASMENNTRQGDMADQATRQQRGAHRPQVEAD